MVKLIVMLIVMPTPMFDDDCLDDVVETTE